MENYTIKHEPPGEDKKTKASLFGKIFHSTVSKHYPGQPSSEVTLKVVYKHIVAIFPFLFALFTLAILGIIGVYYLGQYQDQINTVVSMSYLNLVGFLVIFLLAFLFVAVFWIWRRNKLIITNEHIVDIDQIGLFNRTVSTLRLEEIQDITAKVHGPMQTIFQYGTLLIQTAGERENFVLDYIAEPYEIEHYILKIRKENVNSQKNAMHHEEKNYLV